MAVWYAGRSSAMRRIALLTLLAFGCATTRPPEPPPDGEVLLPPSPRVALAEPSLELWMEGTHAVDPAESAQALAESREALSRALAGRGLDAPDPDLLLVVHARALARTHERKSAQVWSIFAVVFLVVAVVVVAVVAARGSSRGKAPAAARPAGAPPGRPVPYAPGALRPYPPPPPIGIDVGLAVAIPLQPEPGPWIVPTEAWLASRSWFDGDEVELTIELAHPVTGEGVWQRVVRAAIDPRDEDGLVRLVDGALEGLGFGGKIPPAPPAETAEKR